MPPCQKEALAGTFSGFLGVFGTFFMGFDVSFKEQDE
jgi:hypothetical protein